MSKVVVTGISIYSCLGNTPATWSAICQGMTGIKIYQPFDAYSPLPLGLINSQPSSIRELTLQLIQDLSSDAKIELPSPDIGIVIGSSRGCQSHWEQYLQLSSRQSNTPQAFSPPWLETLPSQPARVCAQYLGASQIVSSPANACATGLVAIAQGYELIQQQRCSQVVVGAVETPITPLTIAGFSSMKALAQSKCDPFGRDRDGFVLAEGGAMLLLETEESALNRQATIYGEILGWGINCDAQAMTAPEAEAQTAIKAIAKCLNMAQLQPQDIDYIHAHGTATMLNDQREAKIVEQIFPHHPFVSSTKGATGHTLGASGAIATALNLLSLQKQILLPNISYSPLDFPLNFCQISDYYPLENMLCFSFGFGGQNVIIVMGKY
jgi:3-oxoacyl-[acyl-carrier-protein] synthase II